MTKILRILNFIALMSLLGGLIITNVTFQMIGFFFTCCILITNIVYSSKKKETIIQDTAEVV